MQAFFISYFRQVGHIFLMAGYKKPPLFKEAAEIKCITR